jgi:hypothetical protein
VPPQAYVELEKHLDRASVISSMTSPSMLEASDDVSDIFAKVRSRVQVESGVVEGIGVK